MQEDRELELGSDDPEPPLPLTVTSRVCVCFCEILLCGNENDVEWVIDFCFICYNVGFVYVGRYCIRSGLSVHPMVGTGS